MRCGQCGGGNSHVCLIRYPPDVIRCLEGNNFHGTAFDFRAHALCAERVRECPQAPKPGRSSTETSPRAGHMTQTHPSERNATAFRTTFPHFPISISALIY